jgi:site-specific DNA-methyltransferase (adenine-specific)
MKDCCIALPETGICDIDWSKVLKSMKPGSHIVALCPILEHHRITQRVEDAGFEIRDSVLFLGKPRLIVTLARVPLDGTVAENVLRYGVGAINIDGCRVSFDSNDDPRIGKNYHHNAASDYNPGVRKNNKDGNPLELYKGNGRWPANLIHDGGPEVLRNFPEAGNGWKKNYGQDDYLGKQYGGGCFGGGGYIGNSTYCDHGSAARFFYSVQGDDKVKGLIDYLVKMINPPGGEVLFLGSVGDYEHQ